MNKLITVKEEGLTSLEFAQIAEKNHTDVLKTIRLLIEDYDKLGLSAPTLSYYTNTQNKKQPVYILNKSHCMDLAMRYDSITRIKVRMRLELLEAKYAIPKSLPDALRLAADISEKLEFAQTQLDVAKIKIEEDKSKVVFADSVIGATNSILIRQFAKLLSDEGFEIGQNRLFEWFRLNGYINKRNEPYQNYISQGLFEVIERTIGGADNTFVTTTTKITGKGQEYFASKIKD